jgi:D-alanine-D-alanine ligase
VRAAVLSGGRSSEHEISLASGRSVAAGLGRAGHEVVEVEIDRAGVWRADGEEVALRAGRGLLGCDVVFPVLHGPFGEDGTIQGLLECLDVPYVGAGVLASAVCLDKVVFKDLMGAAGLPQVAYAAVTDERWRSERAGVEAQVAALEWPVFVKPARLGSSVGIVKVTNPEELPPALDKAFAHDPHVIVEAMAHGREVECSVIGNGDPIASFPGEILLHDGADWYDYEAKYTAGGMTLQVPAELPPETTTRVQELAIRTFHHSGCAGLARVDFFVTESEVLVNELNTIPGFTETSVFAKLFEAAGTPYPDLLDRLAAYALERHERERGYSY